MNDFFLFFTIIILTLAGTLAIEFGARELLRITNKKRNRSTVDDRMVHSVMNINFEAGPGSINTFKLPQIMYFGISRLPFNTSPMHLKQWEEQLVRLNNKKDAMIMAINSYPNSRNLYAYLSDIRTEIQESHS